MAETEGTRPGVRRSVQRVTELLHKHELVENLVHRLQGPRQGLVETLVHKLHFVELQKLLDALHPADVAYLLESLPLEQRLVVWDLVKAEREGEILLEVSVRCACAPAITTTCRRASPARGRPILVRLDFMRGRSSDILPRVLATGP